MRDADRDFEAADRQPIAIAQVGFGDLLPIDERAVAAAKVTQTVAAIDLLDDGMVTRDARIRQHQVLPRPAPDSERKVIKRQWGRRSRDFKKYRGARASGRALPWRFRAGGRCGTYRCGLDPHGTAFH